MRWSLLALTLLPLLACAKKPTLEPGVTPSQLAETPRLPSPRAGTYARVIQPPKDPVVRSLLQGRSYDASLGGAAAGLALPAVQESGGFTRRELREAAWQAGYPWPVLSLGVWPTEEKGAPPDGARQWLAGQPAARDVGLIRARGRGKDLWVGLAGEPTYPLGVVPREVTSGQPLNLPAAPGAIWRISDGSGVLRQGTLDKPLAMPLDQPGEWVVQVRNDSGDLARFAVYVDQEAPRTGVLPALSRPLATQADAEARAWELLDIVRREYGAQPLTRDEILASGARNARETAATDLDALARKLSGTPERSHGMNCRASTLEDCVDQILWNPMSRRALVEHAAWSAGLSVQWTPEQVSIIGLAAGS